MKPQMKYYDDDYGEQMISSGPIEKRGGNAISRIIKALRPTYSKRPRE